MAVCHVSRACVWCVGWWRAAPAGRRVVACCVLRFPRAACLAFSRLVVPKIVVALCEHVLLLAPRPVVHRYDAVHDGYLPARPQRTLSARARWHAGTKL
jgi:hypothetical protein